MTDGPTGEDFVNRSHLPFEMDGGIATRAAIGGILLASDHTLEHEFRRLLALPGVAFYTARIANSPRITPETLAAMETQIARTAALILPGARLDVVAFGCTSASMVMGEQAVFKRIREARPEAACTTPVTAALAAFDALGVRRVAVLTPYRNDVNRTVRSYITGRGYEVPVFGSFNEEDDNRVARIDLASVRAAACELGADGGVDAVFVSCTNIRLAEVAHEVERQIGKPVTSSNHALAWHCLRLAGIDDSLPEFGRLFTLPLAGKG